jgi:putative effector of murein hydrolase
MIEIFVACAGTLVAFALARALSARLGNPPWGSPVLIAALLVAGALALGGIPVARYSAAALPLRWLLGPALVALALVIDANRAALRRQALPVLLAVGGGMTVGIGSAIGLARLLGLDAQLRDAVAVKTLSTPFAVAIMTATGGPVALAAAIAVLTGVIGALLVPPMFDRLRITSVAGRALGLGTAAHIVGTDWLTRRDPRAGGLSALAMALAGTLAALLLPPAWKWLLG